LRYRAARLRLTTTSPLPKCLIKDKATYFYRNRFNEVDLNACTLDQISQRFQNYIDYVNHFDAREYKSCVSKFFETCIQGPTAALVNDGSYYVLNPNIRTVTSYENKLKAIGYMLAFAYQHECFLGINIDPSFLSKAFTTLPALGNELDENSRNTIGATCRSYCNNQNVHYDSSKNQFSIFTRHSNMLESACCDKMYFISKLNAHYLRISHIPIAFVLQGRYSLFEDNSIIEYVTKPYFKKNIEDILIQTEPLKLGNWWAFGFDKQKLSSSEGRKLYQCLRRLPQDQLNILFEKTTGLENMPLAGAKRLPFKVKLSVSHQFLMQRHDFTIPFNFECENLKTAITLSF
jgi:hypothetical protein